MQIGLNVKTLRRANKLSRAALAARAGMSASGINSIERGDRFPRGDNITRLARALGVTWEKLVTLHLDGERPSPSAKLTDLEIVRQVAAKFGVSMG